jgi:hypothetical protein
MSSECLHNFAYGYISDTIIYCTKCNKEIDDLYDNEEASCATHYVEDGILKPKKCEDL